MKFHMVFFFNDIIVIIAIKETTSQPLNIVNYVSNRVSSNE